MKELIILIIMAFADPYHAGDDAVAVETLNGEPLVFQSVDECMYYVHDNVDQLKAFGHKIYPNATAVKSINCVENLPNWTGV